MRYFRLPPNLVHRKLIDLALDLANYVPSSSPHPVFELHATIFQKLKKMSVLQWRLLQRMKACINEFEPNTSQANYSEGFWRITSQTNAKIEVRKQSMQFGKWAIVWNEVKSVPLSFLPSKSRLFWWLLSVNLCFLVFNSIFRRENKKCSVFRN